MLLKVETLAKKHTLVIVIIVTAIAAFLTLSLLRNSVDLSFSEMSLGLMAIGLSLSIQAQRKQAGYWMYSFVVKRTLVFSPISSKDDVELLEKYIQQQVPPCYQKLTNPLIVGLTTSLLIFICCWLAKSFFSQYLPLVTLVIGVIILPVWLGFIMTRSAFYYVFEVIESYYAYFTHCLQKQNKPYRVWRDLTVDIVLSLLVNLAVVLPIRYKAAFSVEQGYQQTEFIVAFIILLEIVLIVMLFFSRKRDCYSLCGELLRGKITSTFISGSPLTLIRQWPIYWRYTFYTIMIAGWAVISCFVLDGPFFSPDFFLIYLAGLFPIMLIYGLERYQVLTQSFVEAQQMYQELIADGGRD